MDKHVQPITVLVPNPAKLRGRVFLTPTDELGNVKRGRTVDIINAIESHGTINRPTVNHIIEAHEQDQNAQPPFVRFKVMYSTDDT